MLSQCRVVITMGIFREYTGVSAILVPVCIAVLLGSNSGVWAIDANLQLDGGTVYTEGDGDFTACVVLTDSPSGSVRVTLTIATDSAGPNDIEFDSNVENLEFTASSPLRQCITLSIIDDNIAEGIEMFNIFISSTDNVNIPSSAETISIVDNEDKVMFGFESSALTTTEGQPVEVCVVMLGPPAEREAQLSLVTSTNGGTATSGEDFAPFSEQINFRQGDDRICKNLLVLQDMLIEPPETFEVGIQTLEEADGVAVVRIRDDDGATVTLVNTSLAVMEVDRGATSTVRVCVQVSDVKDDLLRDIELLFNTADESATESLKDCRAEKGKAKKREDNEESLGSKTGARDYAPLVDRLLVIPSGTSTGGAVCQELDVTGDDVREDDETFTVILTMANSLDTIAGETSTTVTILDNGDILAECQPLVNPANGQVTMSGLSEGSTANYSCSNGYILDGPSQRVCGSDGQWNTTEPTCELVDCGEPSMVDNGIIDGESTTFGSVLTYSCIEGYNSTGPETRMCQSNGLWSGSQPTCTIVDCGLPGVPGNGTVTESGTTFGSEILYSCNTGFDLTGIAGQMCEADGQWSADVPECQVIVSGPASSSGDDDTVIIGIAVGVSVGAILIIALAVVITLVAIKIYRKRSFNRYALEYRKHVARGDQSMNRQVEATDDDIHQWEIDQVAPVDILTADIPTQVEASPPPAAATDSPPTKQEFYKENLI